MRDPTFADLVTRQIVTLDELAGRYREYWVELIDEYWKSLWDKTRKETPHGFKPHKQTQVMKPGEEHHCGWERAATGSATTVSAVFVVENIIGKKEHLVRHKDWLKWPLLSECCWIGINMEKNADQDFYNEICKTARSSLPGVAEPEEHYWPAWRRSSILPFERIDDLHAQLTTNRAASQAELIKELKQLVIVIENAESSVATVSKPAT